MGAAAVADNLGRRLTIMLGALIFCLGGALQCGATNIAFLYAGRAIAGLGVGSLVMVVPLYQAEIAHPSIRGRITGLQQLMIGIGSMVATFTTYGTNLHISNANNTQWRLPLGLQLVPAGILAALILLFPESPRWLMEKGYHDKALRTLSQLHASGNIDDETVRAEHASIIQRIDMERNDGQSRLKMLLVDKSSFRRLLLATALQASVQMTGVSAIQYYSPQIYKTIGIGTTEALKYQAISNVLSIVAQSCTILFSDRIGRRWPLITGNLVNCACFVVVTAVIARFPYVSHDRQTSIGWLFIVFNWIYQLSFSFTCGPLSWIIPSEIFDTKTRSVGVSLGVMTSFAFNTMIGQVTSPAISNIGWRYFLLFVICNFTNALFFYIFMPETARLPLEQMHALFSSTSWLVPTSRTEQIIAEEHLEDFDVKDKEAVVHMDNVASRSS